MMAERRYGFRFNGVEGGVLLGGVLLASFLIFVSGVYVGREVAGRKGVAQSQVVRVPVSAFTDPAMTAKSTAPNDTTSPRTVAVNTPLTWPAPKEKVVPPVPSIVKSEEPQQREREKTEPATTHVNVPVAPVNVPRTTPSLAVKENDPPPRSKPTVEPFAPKFPVAVASRSERSDKTAAAQTPRIEAKTSVPQSTRGAIEERRPVAQNPRSETAEKKPSAVTVAHVERIESAARPRVPAPEGKRSGEDKNKEAKAALAATKKAAKQLAAWRVQVGATTYQETAHDMARELRELGYDPMVSTVQMNGETLYRVRIGKFGKQGEAASAVGRFRREGRFSQAYLVSE
jgi:hypothetical protein